MARMADQDLRILLEDRHHGAQRHFLLHHIHHHKGVGADAEIGGAAGQQLRHIHIGSAFADGDVQSAFGVKPFGQRFIEAAMFGLRLPVGDEGNVGQRRRPAAKPARGNRSKSAARSIRIAAL